MNANCISVGMFVTPRTLIRFFLEIQVAGPCRGGAITGFMVSGGYDRPDISLGNGWTEAYGHDGPGIHLGDGQTEAQGVPSQGGLSDSLLMHMPTHMKPVQTSLYIPSPWGGPSVNVPSSNASM